MNITPFGWIVIPVGLILFSMKRRYLFLAVILVAPLFNTSVLYIPALTFYLRTPFFILALLIARLFLDKAVDPSSGLKIYKRSENYWLVLWLIAGGASLLSTIHLSGQVLVHAIEGPWYPVWAPLQFSLFNITQFTYWVFFSLVFLALVSEINSAERVKQVMRWNVYSALLILASGLTTQILSRLGYDSLITEILQFLGAPGTRAPGYILGLIPRMHGLMGEPGEMGLYFAFVLGMVIMPVLTKSDQWLWSRKTNVSLVILLTLGVILSTGTSGYLALFILIVVTSLLLFLQIKPQKFMSIFLLWGLLDVVVLIGFLIAFQSIFDVSFFKFLTTSQIDVLVGHARSGPDRLQFIMDALSLAVKHPFLGVGVGGNKAFALIPQLLSNIGFIGTGFFLMFNGVIMVKVFENSFQRRSHAIRSIGTTLIVAFLAIFGTMAVGKSMASLLYPWYWLLLALMSSLARVKGDVGPCPHRSAVPKGAIE